MGDGTESRCDACDHPCTKGESLCVACRAKKASAVIMWVEANLQESPWEPGSYMLAGGAGGMRLRMLDGEWEAYVPLGGRSTYFVRGNLTLDEMKKLYEVLNPASKQ